MKDYDHYSVGGFASNGNPVGSELEETLGDARECATYLADSVAATMTIWGWDDDGECEEVEMVQGR